MGPGKLSLHRIQLQMFEYTTNVLSDLRTLQNNLFTHGLEKNTALLSTLLCIVFVSQSWWRHQMETFSTLLAICAGNSPDPVNSPHKGQWRGALVFTLICARINGWVNNCKAGDLRRNRAHYDVIVIVGMGSCRCVILGTQTTSNTAWQIEIWMCWYSIRYMKQWKMLTYQIFFN